MVRIINYFLIVTLNLFTSNAFCQKSLEGCKLDKVSMEIEHALRTNSIDLIDVEIVPIPSYEFDKKSHRMSSFDEFEDYLICSSSIFVALIYQSDSFFGCLRVIKKQAEYKLEWVNISDEYLMRKIEGGGISYLSFGNVWMMNTGMVLELTGEEPISSNEWFVNSYYSVETLTNILAYKNIGRYIHENELFESMDLDLKLFGKVDSLCQVKKIGLEERESYYLKYEDHFVQMTKGFITYDSVQQYRLSLINMLMEAD